MTLHKEILYDVKWQSLRVTLLGNFGTFEGVKLNVSKMETYIRGTKDDIEKGRRLWRVLNLLNAVRMGYNGQKLVGTRMDKFITMYRDHVQEVRKDYMYIGEEWDWDKVEKDIKQTDKFTLKEIHKNLMARTKMAKYKVGSTKFRPELMKFMGLLEKEI